MACDDYKDLMMGYLDNELNDNERAEFESYLASHPDFAAEFEEFRNLQKITSSINLAEPEDKVWDKYWSSVYNRLERGIGWILMSISGILLLIYGGFKLIEEIVNDPTISCLLKIGLIVFIAGVAVLFVSILRERIFIRSKDRYKDVRR